MLEELFALLDRWRVEIALYRRRRMMEDANRQESLLEELEEVLARISSASAPPAEAAARTGYSPVQVGRLTKDGTVRQVEGREGTRLLLCDLPVHAGMLPTLLGLRISERPADGPIELQEARLRRRREARRKLG